MQKALLELLHPDIIVFRPGDAGFVIFREHDRGSKIKKLCMHSHKQNHLAFTLDYQPTGKSGMKAAFKQFSCLLSPAHPKVNKKCDFVLVFELEDKVRVVIGDIKSDKPDKTECQVQLRNSELYIKYLWSLIGAYYSRTKPLEIKKYVVHSIKAISNKSTTSYRNKSNKQEDGGITYVSVSPSAQAEATLSLSIFE